MALTHMNRPAQESDELLAMEGRLQTQVTSKANKTQEAWITPTLINGWVADGGYLVGFYKDNFGNVRVRGRVKSGTLGSSAFILPEGYRPTQLVSNVGVCSGTVVGGIVIDTAGAVTLWNGNNIYFALDTISFRAGV